jgi:hypothetical protein
MVAWPISTSPHHKGEIKTVTPNQPKGFEIIKMFDV